MQKGITFANIDLAAAAHLATLTGADQGCVAFYSNQPGLWVQSAQTVAQHLRYFIKMRNNKASWQEANARTHLNQVADARNLFSEDHGPG